MSDNTESNFTTGGVWNVKVEAKSFTLNGGNIVGCYGVKANDIVMNGGRAVRNFTAYRPVNSFEMNGGVIELSEDKAIYIESSLNATFTMNNGSIRNNRLAIYSPSAQSYLTAYLLGGSIVDNVDDNEYADRWIEKGKVILGGDIVISGKDAENTETLP